MKHVLAIVLTLMPGVSLAQVVNFDGLNFPCISYNIQQAQANGRPNALNRTTNATTINANRTAACGPAAGTVTALNGAGGPGTPSSCDEYPFASSTQGGYAPVPGTVGGVLIVPAFENQTQGGLLSTFYTNNGIGNGGAYTVTTSNVPAVVWAGAAPGPAQPPAGGLTIVDHGGGVYQCYY